ncbi:MAG: Ig domain-containing protein [Phocaeicola sp.]
MRLNDGIESHLCHIMTWCKRNKLFLLKNVEGRLKMLIFVLLSFLPKIAHAVMYAQKDISVYVGETFVIAPWNDSKSKFGTGYLCFSTSISKISDNAAFDIGTPSCTTVPNVPDYNNTKTTGTMRTWRVKALKTGTYTVTGVAQGRKSSGVNLYLGTCYVTYNITVKELPVVKSIDIPNNLNLKIGDFYSFSPIILEPGAVTTLTWMSANKNVATISNEGVLKAVMVGTTTITCVAANGITAKCQVSVSPICASNVSLNYEEYNLGIGEKVQLIATITPNNCTDKSVSWKSSNENIAIVNSKGCVVGVNEGHCAVTVMVNDGSNKSASCILSVYKPSVAVESISFHSDGDTLMVGDTLMLIADILPQNATNKNLVWTSSDNNVATVDNGKVQAVGKGLATIVAMAEDDNRAFATFIINVVEDEKASSVENVRGALTDDLEMIYDISGRKINNVMPGVIVIRYPNGRSIKVVKR